MKNCSIFHRRVFVMTSCKVFVCERLHIALIGLIVFQKFYHTSLLNVVKELDFNKKQMLDRWVFMII